MIKDSVSVNEWDCQKGGKYFNSAVKGVWDGGSWSTRSGEETPSTVLLVNANATPGQLKFEPGAESKVCTISTPTDRLHHEKKLQITKQMVAKAKASHVYLPSVLGLGMFCLMERTSLSAIVFSLNILLSKDYLGDFLKFFLRFFCKGFGWF